MWEMPKVRLAVKMFAFLRDRSVLRARNNEPNKMRKSSMATGGKTYTNCCYLLYQKLSGK